MTTRPFIGARIEESVVRRLNRILVRRGWVNSIIPYYGYGSEAQIRVLARVVLAPPLGRTTLGRVADDFLTQRGWRNFINLPSPRAGVGIDLPSGTVTVRSDSGGYVDLRFPNPDLGPGWHRVALHGPGGSHAGASVLVIGARQRFGIVSDIDDTVISTSLPRLLIAAWNSFVRTEQARQSIPGMARMYQRLLTDHPDAPVIYVSTGAWNTFPFLTRFLERHGYPAGPLLLTDWGPTNTGWFRSGPDHKRTALRELAADFPHVRWVLVGDDGQHDIALYTEFADEHPDRARAIAIRELTPTEQVLANGTAAVLTHRPRPGSGGSAPLVRAPDGDLLYPPLRAVLAERGDDGA